MPLQDPGEQLPGAGEGETCGSQAGLGAPAEPTAAGHRHWRWAVRLSAPTLGPGTRISSLEPIYKKQLCLQTLCLRPYHSDHARSRPISEAKQGRAGSVLGWETAWEYPVL